MTEGELIQHLQHQLDEVHSERLALFGLGLGLLRVVYRLGGLLSAEDLHGLAWSCAADCRRVLDEAAEHLGTEDDTDGRINGLELDRLRNVLVETERRASR